MTILWLNWKDRSHPLAGGAELITEELCKRLAADGHPVTLFVAGFPGAKPDEERDGYRIVRRGNRYSVYWHAFRYYKNHCQRCHAHDLVIDEINTIPFFARFYLCHAERSRSILFIHQLAREIWFSEMRFPVNVVGYLLEPVYLWLLRKSPVVTVSESTKRDLVRYGFWQANISVISEGIEPDPIGNLTNRTNLSSAPTLLSLGSLRPMKRTHHIVRAFEIAKASLPDLRLIIAGDATSRYGRSVVRMVERSEHRDAIILLGRVSAEKRLALLRQSHLLAVTSLREGWCLTVTEAASQGTPSVVYDVPGLRDSVRHGETGIVVDQNTPASLAQSIVSLLQDPARYERLREKGLAWSREITFERCYRDCKESILAACTTGTTIRRASGKDPKLSGGCSSG